MVDTQLQGRHGCEDCMGREVFFFLNIFKHLILKIILLASPCVFNVLAVMKKSQMKTPEQTVSETPHLDLSFPPWLCTDLCNAEI